MGKVDDMRAWNEWREYHRALKRDKAVDKLSPVERMRRLEKLEKDPVSWMLFFFAEYTRHPFTSFQKKAIRRITSNPEWYEVLSWSRELAKSTHRLHVHHVSCTDETQAQRAARFQQP